VFDTSVIIPARGEEKRIGPYALDSLLKQTYRNFEVIVVNDPTVIDSTPDVIESYKSKFEDIGAKLRLISQPKDRLGPGGARNVGVENSKASKDSMLGFMDADVKASQNAVGAFVELSKYYNDIVGVGFPIYLESNFPPYTLAYDIGNKMSAFSTRIGRAELRNLFGYTNEEIFEEKFNEGRLTNEDHSTSKRMAKRGRIAWIPDVYGIASSRRLDKLGLLKSSFTFMDMFLRAKVLGRGTSMDTKYTDVR